MFCRCEWTASETGSLIWETAVSKRKEEDMAVVKMKVTTTLLFSFSCFQWFQFVTKIRTKVFAVLMMLTAATSDPTVRKDYRFSLTATISCSDHQHCQFSGSGWQTDTRMGSRGCTWRTRSSRIGRWSSSWLETSGPARWVAASSSWSEKFTQFINTQIHKYKYTNIQMAGDIGPGEMGCGMELMVS